MKLALALCGSLVVGSIGIASAQPYSGSNSNPDVSAQRQEKRAEKRAERLAKFDTNKDGKLDETERAVMREEMATKVFKKMDKNGDGSVSLDEFKQARGQFMKHHRHHGGHRGRKGANNGKLPS